MLEKLFGWIGIILVEFLFGALFKVFHVYRLSMVLRIILGTLVIAAYMAVEIVLVHMAGVYRRSGNKYLMWLCIAGAFVFAVLIIVGYLYQRKHYQEQEHS